MDQFLSLQTHVCFELEIPTLPRQRICFPSGRSRMATWTVIVAIAIAGAKGDAASELPAVPYPTEGGIGPDTYTADSTLTSCTSLDPYPSTVPFNPSVQDARAFCSSLATCGGFLYTTSTSSGGNAVAVYCHPQTFVTGTATTSSPVSFARQLYNSCDIKIKLPTSTTYYHGSLSWSRNACIRPGRGMKHAHDRSPRPMGGKHWTPPRPKVQLSSVDYEVGVDVFRTAEVAGNISADGTSHTMATSSGVTYYMPGSVHSTMDQSARPIAVDGYFPLYETFAGAQAASSRGSGDGQAHPVLPSTLAWGRWSKSPHTQTYYMPTNGPKLFIGNYVKPIAVDGYFPLFRNLHEAQNASSNDQANSHGPGSETGHPQAWSTGELRVFYMPADGWTTYFGTYVEGSSPTQTAAGEPLLYAHEPSPQSPPASLYEPFASLRAQRAAAGLSNDQAAAASTVNAAMAPTNTPAAAATLAGAPVWAIR